MRISKKYFVFNLCHRVLLYLAIGWMGGGRFHTFLQQNNLQKVVDHLPPLHLREVVGPKAT